VGDISLTNHLQVNPVYKDQYLNRDESFTTIKRLILLKESGMDVKLKYKVLFGNIQRKSISRPKRTWTIKQNVFPK